MPSFPPHLPALCSGPRSGVQGTEGFSWDRMGQGKLWTLRLYAGR